MSHLCHVLNWKYTLQCNSQRQFKMQIFPRNIRIINIVDSNQLYCEELKVKENVEVVDLKLCFIKNNLNTTTYLAWLFMVGHRHMPLMEYYMWGSIDGLSFQGDILSLLISTINERNVTCWWMNHLIYQEW